MLCSNSKHATLLTAWSLFVCLCFANHPRLGTAQTPATDETPTQEAEKLAQRIQSDASLHEKAMACRRLALVGNADSVAVLIPLLSDPQLATYARTALEAISDPAVNPALRQALQDLQGEALAGVAGSIGKRRDDKAVPELVRLLENSDPAAVSAAAWALAEIGNPAAARHLNRRLAESPQAHRSLFAAACLHCADVLRRDGQIELALRLNNTLRDAEISRHLQLAATLQVIIARGHDGLDLLAEQLASDERAQFRIGLQAARAVGEAATPVLVKRYQDAPAAQRALIALALADIGNDQATPTLLEAAQEGESRVRVAAMQGLARLDATQAVPPLLDALVEEDQAVSEAALSALAQIADADVSARLKALLQSNDPRILQTAIALARRRQVHAATDSLFALAKQAAPAIRLAATEALGATIEADDVEQLLELAMTSEDPELKKQADEALRAAAVRLPRAKTAKILDDALETATTENQVMILEQLAQLGGPDALRVLSAAASSDQAALQDAGTRLLGLWSNSQAAPALLELARTLDDKRFRLRSLRGYIRMARMSDLTPEGRLEIVRNARALVTLAEDKKRILSALRVHPSPGGLELAAEMVEDADVRGDALSVSIAIAEQLVENAPEDVRRVLTELREQAGTAEQRARIDAVLERAAAEIPESS